MIKLDEIARRHGADKSSAHHGYCETYSRYFEHLRDQPVTLLEIGFGGYEFPDRGGAGAKMWAEYFPIGKIISTDIHPKNDLGHNRINIYKGDQTDAGFFNRIFQYNALPDIIIDDASHACEPTIKSFEILFPLLRPGGIYVYEDTHCSHWSEYGYGGGTHEGTSLNYFKRLTDHLNAEHNGLQPRPDIQAIHFWKQQVFILKSK